ncbi:FAD-dependent oxidoreductase [Mesorhizobium sp. KR9-304]|uniref:NAD(P)/FAD-dependent oxidoreductase n=1 Tax=Mesorhizobium sp. KR9-304 TaxID=3156614 RepID=UPI0032B5BFCF
MDGTAGMVIIGAGECGARAAFALRENGYAGPVTLVGEEAHLPYERPPLSKEALHREEEPEPKWIGLAGHFTEQGISVLTGRTAVGIDRHAKTVRLSDGSALAYDRLLLATGALPRQLPLAANAGPRCVTLRSFDDALAIRRLLVPGMRLVVIGGGFIGLELAASAAKRGAAVTVVEAQPRVLMRGVPEEIASVVAERHRAEGVDIRVGVAIASISGDADSAHVVLADGTDLAADLLVVGIGAVPVTGLAEAAGLAIENGIAVDRHLRTSDPDILAAGDCCSFPLETYGGRRVRLESWRNAQDQGTLAAKNMLGVDEPISAVPWFWSDQHDLTLQIAGLAEGAERHVRRDLGDGAFILFHLAPDGRLLAASGIGPGNTVARDIRLAEMLIAKGARPDPQALASPDVKLKSLLAGG